MLVNAHASTGNKIAKIAPKIRVQGSEIMSGARHAAGTSCQCLSPREGHPPLAPKEGGGWGKRG